MKRVSIIKGKPEIAIGIENRSRCLDSSEKGLDADYFKGYALEVYEIVMKIALDFSGGSGA